jgi:DeoR family transcriptional regulator of aga operon
LTNEQAYDNIARHQKSVGPSAHLSLLFVQTDEASMKTSDRQAKILQHLTKHHILEVSELSDLLQVSPSTIRRELKVMEKGGLLVRSHGIARLPTPIHYELPYENRAAQQVDAKRKIAALAKRLIKSRSVVGLSGGTTITELARQLRVMEDATIVTNAVNVAIELQGKLGQRVIVTGGMMNQNSYELVGDLASQSLQNVHLDKVFLGASGIDAGFGVSMADEPEAVVARAFKAAADQAIVIADCTKIGKATFARFCPLAEVDILITDDGITPEQRAILEETGLTVYIAE